MKKEQFVRSVVKLLKINDIDDLTTELKKNVRDILDAGFVEYKSYDFKENGFQLQKVVLYVALKRLAMDFSPNPNNEFYQRYRELIKRY